MKKLLFFAVCAVLCGTFSAAAQEAPRSISRGDDSNRYSSARLNNLVNDLKSVTVDLVDRTSEDLRGRNAARGDIEAAFLAQQMDASVGFFQEFIRDNRRAAELRDAAAILSDLTRRAPNSGLNSDLWRSAQRAVSDINREIGSGNGGGVGNGGGNNGGGNNGGNNPPSNGRAFWRGTVDKEIQLVIQNRNIETRVISGAPSNNVNFSFTSTLPTRNVTVEAIKKSGRGQVRVIEQPSRDNDYTAVVQIIDEDGGAKEYQLEIVWR